MRQNAGNSNDRLTALERALVSLHSHLRQYVAQSSPSPAHARQRLKPCSPSEVMRQDQSREERYARYTHVQRLKAVGVSHREIARRLKMSRSTVIQFAHAPVFPERATRQAMPSKLDSYLPFLEQRWQGGCTNSSQLWREIQERGYSGKRIQVARWMRQQRTIPAPTTPKKYGTPNSSNGGAESQVKLRNQLPGARQLAWLVVRSSAKLTADERTLLTSLRRDENFEQAYTLVQRFIDVIQHQKDDAFDQWMSDCSGSKLRSFQTFAETLQHDRAAVRAALRESWSTGQGEGQITRVKLVKRQMFGRASFDLLRRRVLGPT